MAAASGQENLDVARWPIAEMLDREPYRFEFFQAVRLLQRMYPRRGVAGRFNNPHEEVIRFGGQASVGFPASEIQALDRASPGPARMTVNFMGLTGPQGMLPLPYSAMIVDRMRERDSAMRDFFDIFNHRAISLFYQAFEKYRFTIPYERGERDRFSHHILALIGLATPGLQERLKPEGVPDDSLLFYSGLLAMHPRSAESLRQVLLDYFRVPVEIDQFVGVWRAVEEESQCALGEGANYSERLGFGAVVGDEVWDQQSRVRIRLGPMTLDQYEDFLPGGEAYRRIRAIAGFFAGNEYDMELQLILKRTEVPGCQLTGKGPQLGWTSWVKSTEFERDAGETILEL
jgi:type VI secretion system protein ImpH